MYILVEEPEYGSQYDPESSRDLLTNVQKMLRANGKSIGGPEDDISSICIDPSGTPYHGNASTLPSVPDEMVSSGSY